MIIRNLSEQPPFTTKDGSTIRSILDRSNSPATLQSLAEASLSQGQVTIRHYHRVSEEFYFITEGLGRMEVNNESVEVKRGDAILIPPGASHQIHAITTLRFLCCCAPPYSDEDTFFE